MHIICPRCKEHLELDGDCRGMEVQCPSCNLTFTAPNVIRARAAAPEKKPGKNAYFGCFLLGLFFNFLGLLIAAIIGGKDGAMAALRGIIANVVIALGLYCAVEFFV